MRHLATIIAASVATPAIAQSNAYSDCADVLKYTGTEQELLWSQEVGQQYSQSASAKNHGFGISYAKVKLDITGSSNRSSSEMKSWQNEYLSKVDKVFEPAVLAWTQCVTAASRGFLVKAQILKPEDILHVEIIKPPGGQYSLQGFTSSSAKCEFQNARALPAQLPDGASYVTCRRQPGDLREADVVIQLSGHGYQFKMPEIPGRPRSYVEGNGAAPSLTRCSEHLVFDAVPYDRKVKVEAVSMKFKRYKSGSKGEVRLLWNGTTIVRSGYQLIGKGLDPLEKTIPADPDREVVIPAFTPAVFLLEGHVEGGHGKCVGASATIRFPPEGKVGPINSANSASTGKPNCQSSLWWAGAFAAFAALAWLVTRKRLSA